MLPNIRLLIVGLCLLMAACTTIFGDSEDSISNEKKAVLNMQLGVRYLELGMLNEAKEKLEKANEQDSENGDIHNALGVFNETIEQNETARYHFEEAIELSPHNAEIKNNYGGFLCRTGSYQEGMALLKQAEAMPLNNRKWFAFTNIGLCYLKQGEQKQAEQEFRKALQIKPNYAPALFEMQKISYQSRNYMSARAFMQRYLEVAKYNAETLWIGIQTERALGNKTLTEQYRQQLLALFPMSDQAQQVKTAINREALGNSQ